MIMNKYNSLIEPRCYTDLSDLAMEIVGLDDKQVKELLKLINEYTDIEIKN